MAENGAREPLRIAAASDLQAALPALAEQFGRAQRMRVECVFGSSGHLAEQIQAGAPFDVFLAANRKYVDDLARRSAVRPDSVRLYARGALALVVYRGPELDRITTLADLKRPEVRKIALANPAFAPYGVAGRQALERSGLWEAVAPKVVQAESVRQALQFVQSGNAEAGLVSLAIAGAPEVRAHAVDPGLYDPILQALGIVAGTKHEPEARAFVAYLLGDEGQAALARSGFKRADDPAEPRQGNQGRSSADNADYRR